MHLKPSLFEVTLYFGQLKVENNGAGLPPQKWGMAELDSDVCMHTACMHAFCKNSQTVVRESNKKPHIDRCFQSKVENIGAGMSTLELGTG